LDGGVSVRGEQGTHIATESLTAAVEWGVLSDATLIGFVLAIVVYLYVVKPVRWFRNGHKGRFPLPWI
jgi:hypothetical protein